MKLKKLTINNIASIEQAVIDFDAAPLKDEHLFLITGETGAGKSTIIDCLCLALYGSTPRLESANRESSYEDLNDKEIKANNPKQLLRRGTVSADVTLTFDDNNGIPYIASWHVQRSNKKLTKHIMDPQRTLETEEGIQPATCLRNKSDIDKKIIEIIGLNMQEFFRTVVLAQGKFAEFLNSNEKDKGNLLEKMTGTEIYTQIGKKIFEVYRDKENRRNNLLAQLHDITLLDNEQKALINGLIDDLGKQFTAVQQQHEGAKKMTLWLDEKAKNEEHLAQKQQDLVVQEEKTRGTEFIEQRQLVTDWEASIEARRELRETRLAQQHITELQEQRPVMQEEFDRLCAALRATISDVQDKQRQVDEIGTYLKHEAQNRTMYESIKAIKSQMKQRQGEQDNISAFTQSLDNERKLLPQVEEEVKSTLKAHQQQEAAVKQLQAQYDQMQVSSINAQKDAVTKAQNALSLLGAKQDAIAQDTAIMVKQQQDLAREEQHLDKAVAVVEAKRELKEQAREALEREKDWKALIEQAHRSLHEGDTCPVCGNIITRLQSPKGEDAIDLLKQRLKIAEDDLQNTETLIAATAKGIERLKQDIADREQELKRKKNDLIQHWHVACQLLNQCGKNVDETADAASLSAGRANADLLASQLDNDLQHLNDTLKSANALLSLITDEHNKLTRLADLHNKAKIKLNKVNDSIKYQEEAIKRSQAKHEELTLELNGLLTIDNWQEQAARNADFIELLEQRAASYQLQVNTARQLENDIKVTSAIIPAMQENQRNIKGLVENDTSCDRVPDNLDELWRQFENKNLNWNNQLANEHNHADRARRALDNHLEHLTMSESRLDLIDRYRQCDILNIKQAHQQLIEGIAHTRGEIAALKTQQQEIIARKPDFIEQNRDALAQILAHSQEQLAELNNQMAEQRALLKQDEINRAIAGKKQQEYELAHAEYQHWQKFNTMLGDSTGNNFRKIAQSYILGELLASANGYLRQFNNRYVLEPKAGTLTILVRDQMQGDLTSVSTLSGGEGFMVSLALALALSSATGKMFSVDTLFIDEGFGSLSENYLDKVMETLNRLYDMGGKRVGIISHVELLKERVTTQVQVHRDDKNNTVSRVTVV